MHYEFRTSIEEQLRDQFIAIIEDEELQRQLIMQFPVRARVMLDSYVRHASAKEIAAQIIQTMHESTTTNVAKVN